MDDKCLTSWESQRSFCFSQECPALHQGVLFDLEIVGVWHDGAMRITVDIPDALYRELMARATTEKRSVKELILRSVETELRLLRTKKGARVTLPLIRSKRPGSLRIDNEKIFEIIPFP